VQRQSTRLLFLDFSLFVAAGVGVGVYQYLVWGIPVFSGLEIVIGFATIGLFSALDLSLAWEHRIIAHADMAGEDRPGPESFFPQTRRFAYLSTGIIVFVTLVLLALFLRDISWFRGQEKEAQDLAELLWSVVWEVIFVMGILLAMTLVLIFSYARNLKLLFQNQTSVLEMVSRGRLDTKVPVVTNDEFAVIAGHTNVMIDRLVERERMVHGLELARQIQTNLLPTSSPYLPGLQLSGSSVFCEETGGDFYDFMVRDGACGPELVAIIGDVTGHGVGAALLMASIRAYMKALIQQSLGLAEVMARTNTLIHGDVGGSGNFVTAFVLSYCPDTRLASWVGAGHDPAWFLSLDGTSCRKLAGLDIPLGVSPGWNYTEFSEKLESGVLVMGTDGVWEAGIEKEEMFGKERLLKVVKRNLQAPPQELAARILDAVEEFTGKARIEDDRTVVIARLTLG
jgi:sigma-B regulation protein RsbU (phosphoserine phosphatase)